jgi:ataxia telangiectasia mutated family protein
MRKGREQFLRQCLENYLLSLLASDEYNHDALRVFSLWLEYSDTPLANQAVKAYLKDVPSGKFALLMNQLSSRLQAEENDFQHLLMELVFRICVDHPFHGMHQIFAIQVSFAMFKCLYKQLQGRVYHLPALVIGRSANVLCANNKVDEGSRYL